MASLVAVESFLDARAAYFARVLQGAKELVSQGLDYLAAAPQVLAYARAYIDLLKDLSTQGPARVRRRSAQGDRGPTDGAWRSTPFASLSRTIAATSRKRPLIAPTHPLRVALAARMGPTWGRVGAGDEPRRRRSTSRRARRARCGNFVGELPADVTCERWPSLRRR